MHNGLLKMGNVKMAGSVGNVVNIVDLFERFTSRRRSASCCSRRTTAVRSSTARNGSRRRRRACEGFYRFFERFERITKKSFFALRGGDEPGGEPATLASSAALKTRFLEHMDDDFNTGGAVGVLYELLTALNRFVEQQKLEDGVPSPADLAALEHGDGAAQGMRSTSRPVREGAGRGEGGRQACRRARGADGELEPGFAGTSAAQYMERFIAIRAEARKAKNFAVADKVRKRLAELKVTLEDRASGTLWRAE